MFTVRKGRKYRATVKLTWLQQQFATPEKIAKKFQDVGFTEVVVIGKGGTREVTGLWPLTDAKAKVPPEVVPPIVEIERSDAAVSPLKPLPRRRQA